MKWNDVEYQLPPDSRDVLVVIQWKRDGQVRHSVLSACYLRKHRVEVHDYDDESLYDHDEETGVLYFPEGWYQFPWDAEATYAVHEKVTHWMPLPEPLNE